MRTDQLFCSSSVKRIFFHATISPVSIKISKDGLKEGFLTQMLHLEVVRAPLSTKPTVGMLNRSSSVVMIELQFVILMLVGKSLSEDVCELSNTRTVLFFWRSCGGGKHSRCLINQRCKQVNFLPQQLERHANSYRIRTVYSSNGSLR